MGHRQKGKGGKRKRSWHHIGRGPDRQNEKAQRRIDEALRRDRREDTDASQ